MEESSGNPEGQGAGAEPGFGDIAGSESLPDMRDELPTFEESYGEDPATTSGTTGSGEEQASSGDNAGSNADKSAEPGTRASGDRGNGIGGGIQGDTEGDAGSDIGGTFGNGTLTTAEQVAILDGQLEQSTSDFDAMILEEQQHQREMDRARAERSPREQTEPAGAGTSGRNPYESDVAMGETAGGGNAGGGMGGGMGGSAPQNPAVYKPPQDIPDGSNDDVVARQLREAAMREPDPEVRERLWNEYRKYKGIEITE